jgi:hypothetical protein
MIFTLVYYDIVHMSSEIIQIIIAPDKFIWFWTLQLLKFNK